MMPSAPILSAFKSKSLLSHTSRPCFGVVAKPKGKLFKARMTSFMGLSSFKWWERFHGKDAVCLMYGIEEKAELWHRRFTSFKLAWELLGDGDGPPKAVITPDGQLCRNGARFLATEIAREMGMRVMVWDRRGSGMSSIWAPMTTPTLPEQEVEDLVDLLDHLFVTEPVMMIGASSGGRLSALLALRHPHLVSSLVILPSGDGGGAIEELAHAYYGDCAAVAQLGGMEALLAAKGNIFYERARTCPDAREAMLAIEVDTFVNVMRRSEAFLCSFKGEHLAGISNENLLKLDVPTLVIHHGLPDDKIHTVEDARAVSRIVPNAQLVIDGDIAAMSSSIVSFARQIVPFHSH